jgi:exocyst complex component 4
MDTVMSAFKSAGVRKRTTDAYDEEYEREKEQVIQEQKETQKRIAQKVPGRRRPKAGDIDGTCAGVCPVPRTSRQD